MHRIQLDGYELVRLPRKAEQQSTDQNHTRPTHTHHYRLTWRMNDQKYIDWRHSIIDSVRKQTTNRVSTLAYQLWSCPGFSGIRSQIGKLAALYKAEVKRSGRKDAPDLPKKLHYVRRMQITGQTLAELIASMGRNRDE